MFYPQSRLRALLPAAWFPDDAPVLGALLNGLAATWNWLYARAGYVQQQTRIETATDQWLDLIAYDYLGDELPRRDSERDDGYRLRIQHEILRTRATRPALHQVLLDLTGIAPVIFEPRNLCDTGAYNVNTLGYNSAGGYGSFALPYQLFVRTYMPITAPTSVGGVAGYGTSGGAYGIGASEYITAEMIVQQIAESDINAAIVATMPAGSVAWVNTAQVPPLTAVASAPAPQIDDSASGSGSLSNSLSASVTPIAAGSIICVLTFGAKAGGCPLVSSVTATGLTFALRKRANSSTIGSAELWWAVAGAASHTVTVTYAAAFDVGCINVLAVSGANPSAPWDVDASLPAGFGSNSAVTPSATISTHAANDLLIVGFGMASGWANWDAIPSGFDLQLACSDSGADYDGELTTVTQTLSGSFAGAVVWPAAPTGLSSFATEAIFDALVPLSA